MENDGEGQGGKAILLQKLMIQDFKDYQNGWKDLNKQQEDHPEPATEFEKEIIKPKEIATCRYKSIPCNDHERVLVDGKKFIHGNYIKSAKGKKLMIATQGPLKSTVADFWTMIVQEKVTSIVMLCKCVEEKLNEETKQLEASDKCFSYYPTDVKAPVRAKTLKIVAEQIKDIEILVGSKTETIVKTSLKVYEIKSKKVLHQVEHFQYLNWKDLGVPESTDALMKLYKSYILPAMKSDGPVVVHCSAGIGRTGVFVGAVYCLDLFLKNQLISVQNGLEELRRQRGKSVQSFAQYTFMHLLLFELIEYSTGKDLGSLKAKYSKYLAKILNPRVKK